MTGLDPITLFEGDCLDVMKLLPDSSIDAIVTDPPYGLGFMGKEWDDLPPGLPWAQECLRVLKPGGHLLAFGGTRTWHRLAVAVEDAGFEIRDSIAWLFGSGFPKGKGQLKPAFEPIVVARKPIRGTVAANVLEHGTGALNIDGCRVEADWETDPNKRGWQGGNSKTVGVTGNFGCTGDRVAQPNPAGRWPANVCLDEDQAAALDEQSGILSSGGPSKRNYDYSGPQANGIYGAMQNDTVRGHPGDGGASRFFPVMPIDELADRFRYQAKAPKKERPTVDGISHPTVKPLSLMRWLCRLVTPPGGFVLDPFAGSGTTGEAAALEGLHAILIERETTYRPLIQARIDRVTRPEEKTA